MQVSAQQAPTVDELVALCAIDNDLFEATYFPKTVRQKSAPFHTDMWKNLEDPRVRYLNMVCFRDSAKTSKLRMFTAKRIAYNLSKTILYVGASEPHAVRSIRWIRSRIEEKIGAGGFKKKDRLAQHFGLRAGAKWTDTELEVYHGVDDTPIWILGAGITGNIRGINFDDYRPDLIVLDDILTDENGATKDQREKIIDLVMGSLKGSLAPATENPNAKLVMLNTPQAVDDVVHVAEKDIEFKTFRYSCWTPETQNLDVGQQVSSWESRHPTETRRSEKRAAIALNRLSTFSKEKEVKIVNRETARFRTEWLRFYEEPPEGGSTVLFVDPTPPPKKTIDNKAIRKLDYEVVGAMRKFGGSYFLLDYEALQGGNPEWTTTKFFEMWFRWRPFKACVEMVNYQATLKWILEQAMMKRQQWLTIEATEAIKSKEVRIQNALHGPASQGRLFVKKTHTMFIQQFEEYPNVQFDDVLDGASSAVMGLENAYDGEGALEDDTNVVRMHARRGCP
jgi:hypothetical protein